jgi:hypothetical protein
MPIHFQPVKLDPQVARKWAKWLESCLPLPQEGWVTGDGFAITNPEKMRSALLADLTGEATSVRTQDALRTDFTRFVRAWQVAAWLEDIQGCESLEDLRGVTNTIAEKKESYAELQLASLRQATERKMRELRQVAAEPSFGAELASTLSV